MNFSSLLKHATFALVSLLLLSGCQATLKPAMLEPYTAISVSRDVQVPQSGYFAGAFTYLGLPFSLLDSGNGEVVTNLTKSNTVDLGKMLFDSFKAELQRSVIASKIVDNATVQFSLQVSSYGLEKTVGFFNDMRPSMTIKAKLVGPDQSILWERFTIAGGIGAYELPHMELDEWKKNPELLADTFRKVADIAVAKLLNGLRIDQDNPQTK